MKRIKLKLAKFDVEFVDREQALKRIEYWADHGMTVVHVIYGPEGCGKSAWLRQGAELLRELGFDVIYLNPIDKEFMAEVGVEDVKKRLLEILREATDESWVRAIWALIDLGRELIRAGRRKIAILADDVFQVISLNKAAIYVKGLLGILEYPPGDYDVAITIAATSEGVSKREIGRHRWAYLDIIWNMPREGFKQLYEQLPGNKPDFDYVWRLTGGNPKLLGQLYEAGWDVNVIINRFISDKEITPQFIARWRTWLEEVVKDPDTLWRPDAPVELIDELIRRNLVIYPLPPKGTDIWIDKPPEKDVELGTGNHAAWQSPLHREAVKKALTGD